jgi:isocitrate/isopropylmalate dehydrogenase
MVKNGTSRVAAARSDSMKLNVLLLPGDGIGVEVTREAAKILNHIAGVFRHELFIREGSLGGIAIHKTGTPFPDESQTLALEADATLIGAVGLPESLLPIMVPRDAHAALFSAMDHRSSFQSTGFRSTVC